jgi:hypothetical protein
MSSGPWTESRERQHARGPRRKVPRRFKRAVDQELQRVVNGLRTIKSTLDPERFIAIMAPGFELSNDVMLLYLLKSIPSRGELYLKRLR